MNTLANIGSRIRVTPWDDVYMRATDEHGVYINDRTPFDFIVEGRLEDGQIFYGLYGTVVSGPERYHNLICNIIIRADGSDWRVTSKCQACFYVGPSIATRCYLYDFRHPDGIIVSGLPYIGRFGEIAVVPEENEQQFRREMSRRV